jgi:hypothetical protein
MLHFKISLDVSTLIKKLSNYLNIPNYLNTKIDEIKNL